MNSNKFFYILLILIALTAFAAVMLSACGSHWSFSGNNVTVVAVDNDTVAPKGSFILLPDTVR